MFLDRIVATKKQEVEQLKASKPRLADWEPQLRDWKPCRGFEHALTQGRRRDIGLIAEVKKASPSKGLIREDFDPVALARTYEQAQADCISVLTDRQYFQGANEYLTRVSEAVAVPLLRKDFIIDPLQIYEARAIGADAILLIAAILTKQQMADFLREARSLGMDVLVEVHDSAELEQVLELDATLIGINNRDLRTFHTDLQTTEKLIGQIRKEATVVSESGIAAPQDLQYLKQIGAQAVLIGEHFMRQPDVGQAVRDLMEGRA
ncbi:indole-3-glycerol phosphate synthase TrpC [Xylanibacillus composti]|uniref:Indole-3-glycerol phosphate synthase n=1 Tax=Xylanibacillus composti TaxID=1572762 RepID=A0A8J4H2T5_9BACL|nr:indole-3-glycerol phosphate synthase TrpC [Xylanibacillus composti]MDT9725470.1 indole-3-glycerol phosphate synthase TrpC [Xylanibacillus composti]GIQ67563.1 indole-3-glycerol-phosphate synthase [Xylanibacillus composti]